MAVLYEGSTPRFLLRIRDGSGVQLNPNLSAGQVTEVKVWIYNSITGAIIAKRYLNTPPAPLDIWAQMTTKEVTSGDHRIQIALTAAETTDKTPNANEIQIELTVPDGATPPGTVKDVGKGKFYDINPAKTE